MQQTKAVPQVLTAFDASVDKGMIFDEPIEDIIEMYVEPNGNRRWEVVGQRNVQEEIDSWRDTCDISQVKKLYEIAGFDKAVEMAANMPQTGVYGDVSELPDNMNDANNVARRMQAAFDANPDLAKSFFDAYFGNGNKTAPTDGGEADPDAGSANKEGDIK